jgi:hypothetical protein
MEVVFKLMVAPEVPTSQSNMVFPAESAIRAQVAVPVASAASSWVMELKVSTPPLAAGAEGLLKVKVPSKVAPPMPSSALAGWVPV